jgi:hypothetical protein
MRRFVLAVVLASLGCAGGKGGGGGDEPKVGNVKEDPRIQRAVIKGAADKAAPAPVQPQTEPKKMNAKSLE